MDPYIEIVTLIGIGFVAGVINTISGGGSALTLPALIFLGLPPTIANGTNRIGILIQSITAAAGFKSKKVAIAPFNTTGNIGVSIAVAVGAIVGAFIAVDISERTFNRILAVVILIVILGIVFKPKMSLRGQERLTGKYLWLSIISFFFIGIYAGFIQAGTGILILLAFSTINRLSLVASNACKTGIVFIITLAAIGIFAYHQQINYSYGIILAIGNAFGGWVASRWSVNKGDGLVKVFMVLTVIIMAIKLWMR